MIGVALLVGIIIIYGNVLRTGVAGIVGSVGLVARLPFVWWQSVYGVESLTKTIATLQKETQDLHGELLRTKRGIPTRVERLQKVNVYSEYALNNKNIFTIAAGSRDGIVVGAPVFLSAHVFLGRVTTVTEKWSEVQTIFDDHMQIATRVSDAGIAALLQGGREPRVTMIDRTKKIAVGDTVYTASRNIPYGLVIGEIHAVEQVGAFFEAQITPPYDMNTIEQVFVNVSL